MKDPGVSRPDMTPVLNRTVIGKQPSRITEHHAPEPGGKASKR